MCVQLADNLCSTDNSVTAEGLSDLWSQSVFRSQAADNSAHVCPWFLGPGAMSRHKTGTLEVSLSALLPQQMKVSQHPLATQISWQTDLFSRTEPRLLHVGFVYS